MDFKKTNPAVLKSMFLQMDKETFVINANALKSELLSIEISFKNANYRESLKRLYLWCKTTYINKF